jgi:MYXO-CTERM domain-containing protein
MSSGELVSPPVTVITIPVESSSSTGSAPVVTSTPLPATPTTPTLAPTETTVAATVDPAPDVQPEVLGTVAAAGFALALLAVLVRTRRRPKSPPTPSLTERVRELSRRAEEGAPAGNDRGR